MLWQVSCLTATICRYLYNNLFFILLQQKIPLRQFLRMALVLICGASIASGIWFTKLTFYILTQHYIHPLIHIWNDYLSSMSCLIPAASRSNSQVCLYSQSETRGVMTRTRTHCDELPDHAFITEGSDGSIDNEWGSAWHCHAQRREWEHWVPLHVSRCVNICSRKATNLHTQDLNLKIKARQSALRRLNSLDEESSCFLIEVFIE